MPPPTPPPLPPPPGPPPTQPFLVNFPPELVDKIAPHGPAWLTWLTGPLATLIAGAFAVFAAAIAFWAVNRQTRANASAVSAQIAAERSERRRAERIDLATEGATLVTELLHIAFDFEVSSGRILGVEHPHLRDAAKRQREIEKFHEIDVLPTTLRMRLLKMPDSANAVEAVHKQARSLIDPLPPDTPTDYVTVRETKDKALTTLQASLEQEVTPAEIEILPRRKPWRCRRGAHDS